MSIKGTPRGGGTYGKHWSHETVPIAGEDHSQYGSEASTPLGGQGYRPDQVFDLSLDYDDDEDLLLDWRPQGARLVCCGWGLPCILPEWWYRLLPRQRRVVLICVGSVVAAAALLVAAVVLLGVQISGFGFHRRSAPSSSDICSWHSFRLPPHAVPAHYNLTFDVSFEQPAQVDGKADISVDVRESSRCIVLHAARLNITSVHFASQTGTWNRSSGQQDQVVLRFPDPLPRGHGLLSLQFQYSLRPGLSGFYLASSKSTDGKSRSFAVTDFEATAARKAFPCFDEPQLKAPFQLQLTAPTGLAALSNTQEVSKQDVGGGRTRRVFAPTPPMSTYLFAMVAGNMRYVHWEVGKVSVRVWATPDRSKAELDAAAKIASTLLPYYENLFGMPYPLQKLDLVAVPEYAGGAMENWGLITFRESYLLADPATAGLQEQLGVASIIAHEMAHMWFGDTTTFAFWGDLWLAEGPATYFENVGGEAAVAGAAFLDRFYADSVTRFLDHDAAAGATHALSTDASEVDSNAAIESQFDPVVYEKGAALLRMLRAYFQRNAQPMPRLRRRLLAAASGGATATLADSRSAAARSSGRVLQGAVAGSGNSSGDDSFITGLQQYLAAHKFGSATTDDLWDALGQASGSDVKHWMDAWAHQPGFPLITLRIAGPDGKAADDDSDDDDDDQGASSSAPLRLTAQQETFASGQQLACGGSSDGSTRRPWWVPLAHITGGASGGEVSPASWVVLDACSTDGPLLELPGGQGAWAKLNAGQLAPVRVQYPSRLWKALAAAAQHPDQLPEVDVAGLIDDAWAIAGAGRGRITPFLDLVRALARRGGAEYAPWAVASRHLSQVQAFLDSSSGTSDCAAAWTAFVQKKLLHGALAAVTGGGSNGSFVVGAGDSTALRLIRPAILRLAGDFGNSTLQAEAAELFRTVQDADATLPPDLAAVVAQLAVQSGDSIAVYRVTNTFQQDPSPVARDRALSALVSVGQLYQVDRVLAIVLGKSTRPQDLVPLVRGLLGSVSGAGPAAVWKFLQGNVKELYDRLDGGTRAAASVAGLVVDAAKQPAAGATAEQLQALFRQHDSVLPRKPYLDTALAAVRSNGAWVQRHAEELCDWLDDR